MATKKPIRESAKAAAAFRVYCSLGPTRSLAKLADYLQRIQGEKGVTLSTIEKWSATWNWQKRIVQWELEQAKLALADMNERHAHMGQRAAEIANRELVRQVEKGTLQGVAAVQWLKTGLDTEFRARGGSEIKRIEHTGKDGDPIQINHVAATTDGTLLTLNLAECTEEDKKLLLQVAENIRKRKDAERTDH